MKLKKIIISLSTLLISSPSFAAGYALMEQSVSGLGRAFAGSAAVADDASTLFFNPAGLTQIKQSELLVGMHYIAPNAEFENDGSTSPAGPLTGNDGGDGARNAFMPNLYYAKRINENVVAGIGITSPFGLVTDYNDDWVGRYHALESNLKTININPSLAFKANDKLSVGVGLNLQYIDLRLSQAVDFGSICAIAGVINCATPQGYDGKAKLDADDWSWGYNLGLTYQFTDATRLGVSYRSKISHHLKGEGKFRLPNNAGVKAVAASSGFEDGDIDGKVTLPESFSLALHHQINSNWAVMADVSWTRWSRFESLTINSDDAASRLNSSKPEDWENSRRYGLGVEYTPAGKWSYRIGIAYDETPVPSSQRRTPRIADNDRIWLAFGASYQITDAISVDGAYAHMFVKDSHMQDVDKQDYALTGSYTGHVDILSLQLRWQFD